MNTENTHIELEKKVLGILISNPILITKYHTKLSVNLFSATDNQIIFKEICQIWEEEQALDLIILNRKFIKKDLNHLYGYCVELVTEIISSAHIEFYIMMLVQLSVKRDFISQFSLLLNVAKDKTNDVFDIRDKAFYIFDNLFIDKFVNDNKQEQLFSSLVDKVQKKFENIQKGNQTGITSSLDIINKAFGGWQNSDLTIVAGRPGMGKTAFLVQQVIDVATQGKAVGVFSLEMSAEQITARIITNYTEIPNSAILRKGLRYEEYNKYFLLKPNLIELKIHIDDTPSISINDLKIKAKMMKLNIILKSCS